ncbi:MAG: transcription-repair coupling factor [Deltaproteobacteria bacterium]|nr:transcription-repair coupling factor [Deltaproteobacteria bacterium]
MALHDPIANRRFDFEGLRLSLEHQAPQTVLAAAEANVVPFVLAALRHRLKCPLLVVVPDAARARAMIEGLQTFEEELWPGLPPVLTWQENDVSPWQELAPLRAVVMRRLAAGYRLNLGLGVAAVVVTAAGLLQRSLAAQVLDRATVLASVGSNFDRVEVVEQLLAGGYERVPVVEDAGTFCLRGGGLDVWSPLYDRPTRLDLEGDDVASIRFFDVETQETDAGGALLDLILPPARELLLDPPRLPGIVAALTDLADHQDVGNVELRTILDELRAGHVVPGMEALVAGIAPERHTLLELAPAAGSERPLVVLDNPDAVYQALRAAYARHLEHAQQARDNKRLGYSPAEIFCEPAAIERQLRSFPQLLVRPFALLEESRTVPTFVLDVGNNRAVQEELRQARGQDEGLRPLVQRIHQARKLKELVVIAAHSEGGRQRLQAILRHYGIGTELHQGPLKPADVESLRNRRDLDALLVLGGSGEGYHIEALHLLVVDEDEVFGQKSHKPDRTRRRNQGHRGLRDISELAEGDYVVHVDHGIGRYVALQRMEIGGCEQDFLLLVYKDDQRLYVPVANLERVQKYKAGQEEEGAARPQLDRLGHDRWQRAKARGKKAVAEVAQHLVKLYAERQARPGHAFSPPDEVYREWEASFPWEETPDQQRAIDDVLLDLQLPRPTDRLVCGDVGYGKTEVAIRAAVKAALDGKQVAVLVPTTVLAEQHRLTFAERCRSLPLKIESLSRFRSPAEQRDIVAGLASGEVDIVVGTHRLLSKDIQFRDLGLLIIDEEHRFGVGHKEGIKKWKATVDCITLSATPIPRTLQLATLGLRDLSLIATPPENRKSVRTLVCRGTDEVLQEALERELSRGGQVFYICNRIKRLPDIAAHLQQICPSAKPVIAHGQQSEQELEDAMLSFMQKQTNVLVTTTIVESGLDIPSANTMFIERADSFGLAQLYQLRGRVGRSNLRAWCYLMVPEREAMTKEGLQRVAVLERFSELGSGVHIASHDLEIRGAGNLLGEEQTGHIAEIGYDLYVKLLEEAVAELRGQELGAPVDPEIKTTVTAYLSDTYIADPNQRLMAYKRLAAVRDDDELDAAVRLLADRYGRLPEAAQNLVETLQIRVLALQLGLEKVEQGPSGIALTLHEKGLLQPELLLPLINAKGTPWRLSPDMVLARAWTRVEQEAPVLATQEALRGLLKMARHPGSVTVDVEPEGPPALTAPPPRLEAPRQSGRRRILGRT